MVVSEQRTAVRRARGRGIWNEYAVWDSRVAKTAGKALIATRKKSQRQRIPPRGRTV